MTDWILGGEPVILPDRLRERVLDAAGRARSAGRPVPDVERIDPTEAFRRATDSFDDLVRSLEIDDWRAPVLRDLDVQGLVGHLIGVEADFQRCVAGDPDVAAADHVLTTQPTALEQLGRLPAESLADWRRAAGETLALVSQDAVDLNSWVALYGMRLPLGSLLVVRAFELWTHENDIRRAVELVPSVPEPSTLRLMTELAVGGLPGAVAKVGSPARPADLHLVLTGPGGGTWDVGVGDGPATRTQTTIVADAVDFCRLAANRLSVADLDAHVSGDADSAAGILTATASLALD